MAVRLHRCRSLWLRVDAHPCWRVQQALDDAGVEYEVVTEPHRRSRRVDVEGLTGQRALPVIEFEDGSAYRAESKEMAERIRAGELEGGRAAPGASPA